MKAVERREQCGPGEYGERRSEGQEDAVGDLLVTLHSLHRDQRDADQRSREVGHEEAQQHVLPPEPAQRQSEQGSEADVTEAQIPR